MSLDTRDTQHVDYFVWTTKMVSKTCLMLIFAPSGKFTSSNTVVADVSGLRDPFLQ